MRRNDVTAKNRDFPNSPASPGPLVGFATARPIQRFGLAPASKTGRPVECFGEPVYLRGQSHVITFGPTGSGKSNIAKAIALTYPGSIFALDLKGDLAESCARYRRGLGQQVSVIDSWNITGCLERARLDPMDVVKLPVEMESALESVAGMLLSDFKTSRDQYWYYTSLPLLTAIMLHVAQTGGAKGLSMNKVVELLCNSEDVVYALAILLDTNAVPKNTYQRGAIANFLSLPDSNNGSTRTCVLSTVQSALGLFRSKAIQDSMGPSTLDVNAIRRGVPVSIFACMPLSRLDSHGPVLKSWLDVTIQALLAREKNFEPPMYLLIDEAAQLGNCPMLKVASTFLRGSGVRLHTFFQDLSQLRSLYPSDWQTILNNAGTWTILKSTPLAARELAAITNLPAEFISGIAADEQIIIEVGHDPVVVKMPRYWEHPYFAGRFDPPRRYQTSSPKSAPAND
jgi:type IV secretion system protein VirD4